MIENILAFLVGCGGYLFGYYIGKRRGRYEAVRDFQANAKAITRYNLGAK